VCKVKWCSGWGGGDYFYSGVWRYLPSVWNVPFFLLLAVARICLAVLKIALLCGIWWGWGGSFKAWCCCCCWTLASVFVYVCVCLFRNLTTDHQNFHLSVFLKIYICFMHRLWGSRGTLFFMLKWKRERKDFWDHLTHVIPSPPKINLICTLVFSYVSSIDYWSLWRFL